MSIDSLSSKMGSQHSVLQPATGHGDVKTTQRYIGAADKKKRLHELVERRSSSFLIRRSVWRHKEFSREFSQSLWMTRRLV
jgi:hypothetical protein